MPAGIAHRRCASSLPVRLALIALLLLLIGPAALSACGGASQPATTPSGTPQPILQLPAQLAGRHVFVTDLASGTLAEMGTTTLAVSRSVHGLGISSDRRWL